MRFRLAAGQRSGKYNPGQFVSASYANRYPHKVRASEPPPPPEYIEDYIPDYDDWDVYEITAEYEG